MTEFYAKIVPTDKGMFRFRATIWRSENNIDSPWMTRGFFTINAARRWSIRNITKLVFFHNKMLFIKEQDIVRRKWNEQ